MKAQKFCKVFLLAAMLMVTFVGAASADDDIVEYAVANCTGKTVTRIFTKTDLEDRWIEFKFHPVPNRKGWNMKRYRKGARYLYLKTAFEDGSSMEWDGIDMLSGDNMVLLGINGKMMTGGNN